MASGEDFTASELASIIDDTAAQFGVADSEEEQPEAEDTDEVDELEESEEDEDFADDDESEVDDEDPDEDEDDDQDSLEDDEEEDESEEEDEDDEEDDEDEDDAEEAVALDDEVQVRLPDGTELTGRELREGYLRQQDYTQKTQRVSDVYRKMEQWYEQRAKNPTGWIAEIAYGQEDPAEAIAGALRETGNSTVLFGQMVRHMVEQGDLADELVEAMNLTNLAEQAKDQQVHQKVQSLEQQIQQRDQQAAQQQEMARIEKQLNDQWANVVSQNELEFESSQQAQDTKVRLLEFARDNGIPNLEVAYAAMTHLGATPAAPKGDKPKQRKTPKKRKQAEAAVKKRKTAAMSRKPTGGSGAPPKGSDDSGDVVQSAAESALAELGLEL